MSKRLGSSLVVAFSLTAGNAVVGSGALAHEQRTTGSLQFVVGWGEEPPYTGLKNSVEIDVSDDGGAPVTDLRGELKAEVSKGTDKVTLALEPVVSGAASARPGLYRAWLTPTRPGAYTFRLTGNVRGRAVDESFTSTPTTFEEVVDVGRIQFPAKDPSTGQLESRLDRELPRLSTRTDAIEVAVHEAEDRVDQARTLAMAGAGAGALGLLAAAGALVVAHRATHGRGGSTAGAPTARSENAKPLSR